MDERRVAGGRKEAGAVDASRGIRTAIGFRDVALNEREAGVREGF